MSRDRLFDLAVERALAYAVRVGALREGCEPGEVVAALEVWYLRTRFAYRVPLVTVAEKLCSRPGPGYRWHGGPNGAWRPEADA